MTRLSILPVIQFLWVSACLGELWNVVESYWQQSVPIRTGDLFLLETGMCRS